MSLVKEREAEGASEEVTSAATRRKGKGRVSSEERIDDFAGAPLLLLLRLAFREDGDEEYELDDSMAPADENEAMPRRERERGNETSRSKVRKE